MFFSVRGRLIRDTREQRRWDRLIAAHHDLSFRRFYRRAIRHVAVCDERWLALVGERIPGGRPGPLDRLDIGAAGTGPRAPMAQDDQTIRARQHDRSPFILVSAFEHSTCIALGSAEVANGTHEITAVRALLQELDLRDRIITLATLHTQGETACPRA